MDKEYLLKLFYKNKDKFKLSNKIEEELINKFFSNFEISKDNNPNFKNNDRFIYSKYTPCAKFKDLNLSNKEIIIFLENGIGLSFYYFQNFIRKNIENINYKILLIFSSLFSFFSSFFIIDYSEFNNDFLYIALYDKEIKSYSYLSEIFIDKKNEDEIFMYNENENKIIIDNNIEFLLIEDQIQFSSFLNNFMNKYIKLDNDFLKFKFCFENPDISFSQSDIYKNGSNSFVLQIIEKINEITQKHHKSIITEKYFSNIWQRNIEKNLLIFKEKNWDFNLQKIDFNKKDGIILWGASEQVERFLNSLDSKSINTINNKYYSIAITSSVKLLQSYGLNVDYQTIFDAGIFSSYNVEDYSIPMICSAILHPAITKKLLKKPFLVNLQTEQEKKYKILNQLPSFPFYGSTLPTLYKGFKYENSNKFIKLFMIGSSFELKESRTHIQRYPLYKYIISKSSYFNPALNWETFQKIINAKKFNIYRKSLENLNVAGIQEILLEISKNLTT